MKSFKSTNVRAMVMAAGAGTRLRPLTDSVAKPMVPVANRPVLEYTIENLRRHGITDMVFNLHSKPEQIQKYFGNGSAWGVHIEYSYEKELLGTAGGVKNVASFLEGGTFLVMSGDGLTTIDLTALLRFHRQRHSVATMAIKSIDTRFEYGVTLSDARGRITRFVEKPAWGDVFSSDVNTGIYVFEPSILSMIPSGQIYDFGHQLWPRLLKLRKPIYTYRTKAYWCDVGNLNEYRRAHRDFLSGQTHLKPMGHQIRRGVWVENDVTIEKGASLEAPCLIGEGSHIEKGAQIGPQTIVGKHARIGPQCVLRQSILWDHVQIKANARLENCIISEGVRVNENASIFDGVLCKSSIH